MPPGIVCVGCLNPEPVFTFSPVSGSGTIRSWTTILDSFLPGFKTDLPYRLVDVELDEQVELRMIGRLVDGADVEIHLGDRVTVAFDQLTPEIAVPAFRLVGS